MSQSRGQLNICMARMFWRKRTDRVWWIPYYLRTRWSNAAGLVPTPSISPILKISPAKSEPVDFLYSGIKRDLNRDTRFRDTLDKFEYDGNLSDTELRQLLFYFGMLVRLTELTGQRYYLAHAEAINQHRKLCALAARRGWNQGYVDMIGVTVEGVFDPIER
jgi:hypothetical protein